MCKTVLKKCSNGSTEIDHRTPDRKSGVATEHVCPALIETPKHNIPENPDMRPYQRETMGHCTQCRRRRRSLRRDNDRHTFPTHLRSRTVRAPLNEEGAPRRHACGNHQHLLFPLNVTLKLPQTLFYTPEKISGFVFGKY